MNLKEIAQQLNDSNKKVQLIYAFNGTGKTRLSREFKSLIPPKADDETESTELKDKKILYYNAFTEDLFYWDNDLENDKEPTLNIHPNIFTRWVFTEESLENTVIKRFQHYTDDKLTPILNPVYVDDFTTGQLIKIPIYNTITFSYQRGNDETTNNIKISKGEESCFVWSVFYSFLDSVVEMLNLPEIDLNKTDKFDQLKYIFIDDPVTSLDDNHLIELAVNLASLIKKSNGLKFIISTHNPLFYNVIFNELTSKSCYMLNKLEDGTYKLDEKKGDSNKSFSYHLFLMQTIREAIDSNNIQKYHFTLLRNLYEKTANFLGYPKWSDLLPDDKQTYYNRVIQFTSHSTLSNEVVPEPTDPEKKIVKFLLDHLVNNRYWKEHKNDTI